MDELNRIALNGLRAAAVVAREGSLSRAAQVMGVSVGAVSQQVSRTEKALGLTLFARQSDGMVPTDQAAPFLRAIEGGFSQISGAVEKLNRQRDNVVTLSVAPIFAARWLIWRLRDFYRLHPEIKVKIELETRLIDPARDGADFGIRVGNGNWPGLRVEPLFEMLVVPVCSPKVAAQLKVPADLANVPIIREPHAMYTWDAWLAPEGLSKDILGDGPELPDASMCLDAAIAGMGVFLAFEVLAREGMDYGPLALPFPRYRPTGFHYALVSAKDQTPGPAPQVFRRWLKAKLREEMLGDRAVVP